MNNRRKSIAIDNIIGLSKQSKIIKNSINDRSRGSSILKDGDSISFLKMSNKKGVTLEQKTRISHISEKTEFNIKEDFEDNKTNILMDKIITQFGKDSKRLNRPIDQMIGLENNKSEINLLKKIELLDKNLLHLTVVSIREENQNYELVEKIHLDSIRKENDAFINQIKIYNDQIDEINKTFKKISGETNFLNSVNESQDKSTAEYQKRLKKLNVEIVEANMINKKLIETYTKEKIEKDNSLRALINYTQQFDKNLSEELQKIYISFNNQFFLATHRPTDEQYIEEMLGRMDLLEREIIKKNSEIQGLNKIIPKEEKKKENINSILPPLKHQSSIMMNKTQDFKRSNTKTSIKKSINKK